MSMSVGGQAVIEGVMMRTPGSMAVAVRRADGTIEVRDDAWYSITQRVPLLKAPFLRGAVVLFESMHNGVSALTWSAERQELDDAADDAPDDAEDADAAPEAGSWAMTATIGLSLMFSFGLFVALPHILAIVGGQLLGIEALDGQSTLFHGVAGVLKLMIFLGYLWSISRLDDIHRVFQYHGAEHKAIYAWEAQQELNVDNARAHTRLHPRCGTSFLFIVVMTSILVFAVVFGSFELPIENRILKQLSLIGMKLPLLFPIAGIAFEFQRLSARFPNAFWVRPLIWPGLMLQKITTQEPTDDQLEVALASLKVALAREAEVQQTDSSVRLERRERQFSDYAAVV